MSNNKLNIAKTIKVGFNKRSGTYTGLLAYVIYYDEKNVLRKENSWNSWRDKSIDAQEYPNEPTSGFVLNKKVGDYKSDWNHRMAHIRVYDPRGFEFEISVENLLYILQECTSTKGKGLEGEFVYAWDGTTLVLLPTDSVEYQESKVFTEHKLSKVSKSDMVAGCVYLTKDMENVLYLGREDYYEFDRDYDDSFTTCSQANRGKKHIFVYTDKQKAGQLWVQTGFTKIASKISDAVSTSFPEEYEKFKHSFSGSPVTKVTMEEVIPKFHKPYGYVKLDNGYNKITNYNGKFYSLDHHSITDDTIAIRYKNECKIDGCKLTIQNTRYGYSYSYSYPNRAKPDNYQEQVVPRNDLKLYVATAHNEYGKTHELG